MVRPIVALFVLIPCSLCRPVHAGEPPKILAAGAWSQPVADERYYALRGRLVVCGKSAGDDRRETPVYVELQDASGFHGESMQLFCDMGKHDFRPEYKGGLNCELRDQHKKLVKTMPFAFGGQIPKSEWVTLPGDATIRLRASPFGLSRVKGKAICPHLGQCWEIADDDPNEYYLSGTFTIDPPADGAPVGRYHVWRGTIALPAVRIGK